MWLAFGDEQLENGIASAKCTTIGNRFQNSSYQDVSSSIACRDATLETYQYDALAVSGQRISHGIAAHQNGSSTLSRLHRLQRHSKHKFTPNDSIKIRLRSKIPGDLLQAIPSGQRLYRLGRHLNLPGPGWRT